MQRATTAGLRIGDWRFDPALGELARNGESIRLEVRTARLLACLAERAGQVVSSDELLERAWAGVTVSQDSVYQAIASLRRVLGDDPKEPRYIETVPRLGYRMVAEVGGVDVAPLEMVMIDQGTGSVSEGNGGNAAGDAAKPSPGWKTRTMWIATASALIAVGIAGWAMLGHFDARNNPSGATAKASPPANSIAVLPFLDLTEGMKNQEFADGITEELIDRVSRITALHVASPTSSFYFKGKQVPVADIAQSLGVAWVLDGSLRTSGTWVRVDARLVRAESGYVAWSATYDQPMSDILTIQDDIARKVTSALKGSIGIGAHSDASP